MRPGLSNFPPKNVTLLNLRRHWAQATETHGQERGLTGSSNQMCQLITHSALEWYRTQNYSTRYCLTVSDSTNNKSAIMNGNQVDPLNDHPWDLQRMYLVQYRSPCLVAIWKSPTLVSASERNRPASPPPLGPACVPSTL